MYKHTISKEEVNQLPVVAFEGEIILVETEKQVKQAFKILKKQKVVGLDTETRPSFTKGKMYKVALVQIATEEQCFLFRINKIDFHDSLVKFLNKKTIKKIGLDLNNDFKGLSKLEEDFEPKNIVDIQKITENYGILDKSLQKIFAIVFKQKISKNQQLSNWENDVLTEKQQIYAATDAWAALMIYNTLQKAEKLSKAEIEAIKEAVKQENNEQNNEQNNS